MKKIIIFVSVTILLVVGLGLVFLYNMGGRLIEEAIKMELFSEKSTGIQSENSEYNEENTVKEEQTEQAGQAEQTKQAEQTEQAGQAEQTKQAGQAEQTEQDKTNQTDSVSETPLSETTVSQDTKTTDAEEDKPAADTTKEPVEEKVFTVSKIDEIKKEISADDRIYAAALVVQRLSAEVISELREMVSDGLDAQEREKITQLVYAKFTAEDIVKIKELYTKYIE